MAYKEIKHSLQICSNNPVVWWTVDSVTTSEGIPVIVQPPLYLINNKLKLNQVLYLSINKKGLEPDILVADKGEGALFIKKAVFDEISTLMSTSEINVYLCKDIEDGSQEYSLILPNKLVTTEGLITYDGSWIEVKKTIIEKLSSLKTLGINYCSYPLNYEEYPNSQSFEKRLIIAKEICNYAQVLAIALELDENDEKLNSIGFPCDGELEILFNETPLWDNLLVEFYEESAHNIKHYLQTYPEDRNVVEIAWKKAGLKTLENMPLSKVSKEELELDPVYKFLSSLLSQVDPVSFQGAVNYCGAPSLNDYLLLIKEDVYFSYKRQIYSIYEVLAALISRWSLDKVEKANKVLKLHGCQTIHETIETDNFFRESYLHLPKSKIYKLPEPK